MTDEDMLGLAGKLTAEQEAPRPLSDEDIRLAQKIARTPPTYAWCDVLVTIGDAALEARQERDKLLSDLAAMTTERNLYREMLKSANKDLSNTERALQQVRLALDRVTRLGIRLSGRRW